MLIIRWDDKTKHVHVFTIMNAFSVRKISVYVFFE